MAVSKEDLLAVEDHLRYLGVEEETRVQVLQVLTVMDDPDGVIAHMLRSDNRGDALYWYVSTLI